MRHKLGYMVWQERFFQRLHPKDNTLCWGSCLEIFILMRTTMQSLSHCQRWVNRSTIWHFHPQLHRDRRDRRAVLSAWILDKDANLDNFGLGVGVGMSMHALLDLAIRFVGEGSGKLRGHILAQIIIFVLFTMLVCTIKNTFMISYAAVCLIALGIMHIFVSE